MDEVKITQQFLSVHTDEDLECPKIREFYKEFRKCSDKKFKPYNPKEVAEIKFLARNSGKDENKERFSWVYKKYNSESE